MIIRIHRQKESDSRYQVQVWNRLKSPWIRELPQLLLQMSPVLFFCWCIFCRLFPHLTWKSLRSFLFILCKINPSTMCCCCWMMFDPYPNFDMICSLFEIDVVKLYWCCADFAHNIVFNGTSHLFAMCFRTWPRRAANMANQIRCCCYRKPFGRMRREQLVDYISLSSCVVSCDHLEPFGFLIPFHILGTHTTVWIWHDCRKKQCNTM